MERSRRVLILSAGVGSGHLTAAAALAAAARRVPGVDVRNEDALSHSSEALRTAYADLYNRLVRHLPQVVGWWYDLQDTPFRGDRVRSRLDRLNAEPLVRMIVDYRPDIVICTHFMPSGIVSALMSSGVLETVLGIATTDYDFQGMWLSRTFHRIFVALPEARAYLATLGVPTERVGVSGIPISPLFETVVDRDAVLERFGLTGDRPVLLLSAGTAASPLVPTIVQQLLVLDHDVDVVVVCGRNAELHVTVDRLVEPQRERFRVLGYTTHMADLMRVADLFIGKPGGLTSAECMAAGLPMVVIDPIPGQEERNADYLLEAGAAIRCRDLPILAFKIGLLLKQPERLAAMRANTARLAQPAAARTIVHTLLNEQLPPVVMDASRP